MHCEGFPGIKECERLWSVCERELKSIPECAVFSPNCCGRAKVSTGILYHGAGAELSPDLGYLHSRVGSIGYRWTCWSQKTFPTNVMIL